MEKGAGINPYEERVMMNGVKEDRLGETASLRRLPENPVCCMCAQSLQSRPHGL